MYKNIKDLLFFYTWLVCLYVVCLFDGMYVLCIYSKLTNIQLLQTQNALTCLSPALFHFIVHILSNNNLDCF